MMPTEMIDALAALGQGTRFAVVDLLAADGAERLAGEIASTLKVPANTMSTHLAILARAGLVLSERRGREIAYRVDFDRLAEISRHIGDMATPGSGGASDAAAQG